MLVVIIVVYYRRFVYIRKYKKIKVNYFNRLVEEYVNIAT